VAGHALLEDDAGARQGVYRGRRHRHVRSGMRCGGETRRRCGRRFGSVRLPQPV